MLVNLEQTFQRVIFNQNDKTNVNVFANSRSMLQACVQAVSMVVRLE